MTKPLLLIIGPLPPPFIGPAIATQRLLESQTLAECFDIAFVNTGDPEGFDDIGRLGWHNISMALRHGALCIGILVRRRPAAIYVPIARGIWGFVRDLLFILPARLLGTRVFVHLRAGRFDIIHDNGWLGRAIARFGLAGVERALVLGTSVSDVFGNAVNRDRVRVVANGMNLEGWDAAVWSQQRAGSRNVRIAYIANLYHDKGIHVMIEAMSILTSRGLQLTVAFAGDWGNAAYRETCIAAVERLGLQNCVSFIGRVDDEEKRTLLSESHIAVFVPVMPEGLPWVVLEAMSAALPVIGTPQGTIAEIIIEGTTGYIVPIGDHVALADRLAELAADEALRARMGASGRLRIENVYTEEKTHRRLADIILECVE